MTLAETYARFGAIAAGVLRMLADISHVRVTEDDLAELRPLMQSMPPHPEVPDALRRLGMAGLRLVTLTNSAPQPDDGPLERTRIAGCFERQFSVDAVRRYKPAPGTCRMVAQQLGVGTRSSLTTNSFYPSRSSTGLARATSSGAPAASTNRPRWCARSGLPSTGAAA
jgi:2-haloacid dehalogenase